MLDPLYMEGVENALDAIENDPKREKLWWSVVDTLTMICDSPDSPISRRHQIRHPNGTFVWRVPVPAGYEDENYSILWEPHGTDAVIHYVGVWPPPSTRP